MNFIQSHTFDACSIRTIWFVDTGWEVQNNHLIYIWLIISAISNKIKVQANWSPITIWLILSNNDAKDVSKVKCNVLYFSNICPFCIFLPWWGHLILVLSCSVLLFLNGYIMFTEMVWIFFDVVPTWISHDLHCFWLFSCITCSSFSSLHVLVISNALLFRSYKYFLYSLFYEGFLPLVLRVYCSLICYLLTIYMWDGWIIDRRIMCCFKVVAIVFSLLNILCGCICPLAWISVIEMIVWGQRNCNFIHDSFTVE